MSKIQDKVKYSAEIASAFCGELGMLSVSCKDGCGEHVCNEEPSHAGSHVCGFCGFRWGQPDD